MSCGSSTSTLEGQTTKLECKYDQNSRTITLYLPSNYDVPTVLSTVSGWAHDSDVTKIDGGTIYTDSIVMGNISGDLDDIDDGTTYAKILSSALSSGSALLSAAVGDLDDIDNGTTYGRVNITSISAGNILLAQCTGDLDDISNGTNYGKVNLTSISAGNILLAQCSGDLDDISNGTTYGKVNLTSISAGNILLAQCSGDLDDVSDGTTYGKVALTSISAGKIIVAGLDSGVTDRMFADSTTKTNIEAWRHASDVTMIDGGDIYTSTVTASQINGAGFGTLTITSGKIAINTTDALQINAAGNILVDQGADIIMTGGASGNPSLIKFDDNDVPGEIRFYNHDDSGEYHRIMATNANRQLAIAPYGFGDETRTAQLGSSSLGYTDIFFIFDINDDTPADNRVAIYAETGGAASEYYGFYPLHFKPTLGDKQLDFGLADCAWDDAYADDWHNVADFFHLDSMDDLTELHKIKGSGIIDERTGFELIDDNSLPEWMLTRAKEDVYEGGLCIGPDGEKKEVSRKLTIRKGDILYDSEGKPYISLKTAISHLWGCVKQLDKKVELLINTD